MMETKRMELAPKLASAALLSMTWLGACGGGAQPASSGGDGTVTCNGEERLLLNCDSEVSYDATDVKGGLSAVGIGAIEGGSESKALREIDDQTAQYIAQTRRLCDEYNKCVIDKAAYATRSENLRRRVAKVPELVDAVKNASTDEDRRIALAKAYRELVPEEARTELQVSFSVMSKRPGEAAASAVSDGASLPSGTRVAFVLQVSRAAHAYLFQKSADGSLNVLFPDPRITIRNPIPAGEPLRIPQGGASFKLDDQDIGTERVYLVASLQPLTELAAAAEQVQQGAKPTGALEKVTAMQPGCNTRALSFEGDDSSSNQCYRTRALTFEDEPGTQSAPVSFKATTEAADDTIATVFSFEHTR